MTDWVLGRRAVREFLAHAPDVARALWVARGSRVPRELLAAAEALGLPVRELPRHELSARVGSERHQGVALEVGGWVYADPEEFLAGAKRAPFPLVLALDCVQDPRNLGAVIRVADGVGAAGVLIPKDRAAGLGPAAARAAAGALAAVPVARVVNLARALDRFRDEGFWVYAAAAGGDDVFAADLAVPAVLVLGGEHAGIRPNVLRRCDRELALPMRGKVGSLNVAVAAGILAYEFLRRAGAGAPAGGGG
ncbi:MAG: 23S rRNA (guanosine(2251)-2'-O)-methyltransferase RlmB [Candidatus Dadabacteria bacterium]|nr:MAG: 23S rRNA (guanosine(2251)-2'-O)-methyltransferase RlmB [Candidatus Dadabacteria bacterium]